MKLQRLCHTLAALLFAYVLGVPAAKAEDLRAEHVKIELDTKKSRKPPKAKKKAKKYQTDWKKTCEQLAKAMTAEKGPWGYGVFGSYACYREKTRVAGTEKPAKWQITVTDGAKEVSFVLYRLLADGSKLEMSKVTMPPSEYTVQFFQDDEFSDLVAFTLMDALPVGMLVTKPMLKGSPPKFKGRHWRAGMAKDFKYGVPPPPEELTLYRLSFDEGSKQWRSKVVGSAKKVSVTEPKKKKQKKQTILVGGDVTYETSDAVAAALSTGTLWAHNANGPGARATELGDITKEAQLALDAAAANGQLLDFLKGKITNVLSGLLDTAASGYVGLRYGLQVIPGDELLSKMSFFGLLVEVRGGPVKGLRYYYDKYPETTLKQEGAGGEMFDTSISSSRHTLGFSVDFNPGFLVDRLTVDPKIGMWAYNATLMVERVEGTESVKRPEKFELGNTVSLALEVGAELLSDWYTLRGWYAIDSGFSLLKTGGKVTSNRFGIDAFFTAGPTFPLFGVPFKTALMAFYFYEDVSISREIEDDLAAGEVEITEVPYQVGFAGGGVGISW